MSKLSKVTVVGSGYVGMSISVLLAQKNEVKVIDIDPEKVSKINNKVSTINDKDIDSFFLEKKLSIKATESKIDAYKEADFIIVATPTDFKEELNYFDTTLVDEVLNDIININNKAIIVIKSTLPIGHTKKLQKKFNTNRIIFSPEFLREGSALYDNLYPSRIIVGNEHPKSIEFSSILVDAAKKKSICVMHVSSSEAEAIKLFSNSYLAMRVAFFNELDSFAMDNKLNAKNIIDGISMDKRIGNSYNNPSFGYGGYCLPKDTKQLLSNFDKTPQSLINSIVESNILRKNVIAKKITKKNPKSVGIYRLIMKKGSDNHRFSAVHEIIEILDKKNIDIIIYEPLLENVVNFNNFKIEKNIEKFKEICEIIVANRFDSELDSVKDKVFTRDIFFNN